MSRIIINTGVNNFSWYDGCGSRQLNHIETWKTNLYRNINHIVIAPWDDRTIVLTLDTARRLRDALNTLLEDKTDGPEMSQV